MVQDIKRSLLYFLSGKQYDTSSSRYIFVALIFCSSENLRLYSLLTSYFFGVFISRYTSEYLLPLNVATEEIFDSWELISWTIFFAFLCFFVDRYTATFHNISFKFFKGVLKSSSESDSDSKHLSNALHRFATLFLFLGE